MAIVSMKSLLETGAHFGHRTRGWNPKMRPYIFAERNGIHILDLNQTQAFIEDAYDKVRNTVADGGQVLFVGTKRQAKEIVSQEAARARQPYVNQRWLGGTLTNWQTIRKRIEYLKDLENRQESGEFDRLKKKERLQLERELNKLNIRLGGLRNMQSLPDLLFVVGTIEEHIAIREANRLKIPTVALVDSNCDPDPIDYLIPSNDDAIRAIKLITSKIADAVVEGSTMRKASATDDVLDTSHYSFSHRASDYRDIDDEQLLGPSTLDKLNALKEIFEVGLITIDEYDNKKIQIIGTLEHSIEQQDKGPIVGKEDIKGHKLLGHENAVSEEIEAFAFANLNGLSHDDTAYIGRPFVLQAGILRQLPQVSDAIRKYARVVLPKSSFKNKLALL